MKKRVWLAKGYGSFQSAWRTLQSIETVHMIRKGRVRWLAKDDAIGQALFITDLVRHRGVDDFNLQSNLTARIERMTLLQTRRFPPICRIAATSPAMVIPTPNNETTRPSRRTFLSCIASSPAR